MLTKSDLTAIRTIVKEEVTEQTKNLTTKEELRASTKLLDEKITTFKDEILGRIEKSDEEMEVTKGYGDKLEDHEDRISVLEKSSLSHSG